MDFSAGFALSSRLRHSLLREVKNVNLINCKCNCTLFAIIAAAIIGIVAAFAQIAAVITVTPVFLWVALGIAVVYLAGLAFATILARTPGRFST